MASALLDISHQGDTHRAVRMRNWPVVAGLLAATLYVAAATVTGQLGPLSRRPIFDGFLPPPPYRWVDPPPSLEDTNQEPLSQTSSVPFKRETSQSQVISTPDLQASIFLVEARFLQNPERRPCRSPCGHSRRLRLTSRRHGASKATSTRSPAAIKPVGQLSWIWHSRDSSS